MYILHALLEIIILFVCPDVPPLPLYQQILLFYVTFLAHRLSYKSIKVYLSGIQFCSNFMGLTEKVSEMCQLFYVLHGIRRVQG